MNFIPVTDNEMINADKIVSIKIQEIRGSKKLILMTDNKSFTVDAKHSGILDGLLSSGVNLTKQFTSV